MPFDTRALRVQLPCGPVTVIAADELDAKRAITVYWGHLASPVAAPCNACTDCSSMTDLCKGRSERGDEVELCAAGSEPLSVLTVLDVAVLPVLRRELERQLEEVRRAEKAVAAHGQGQNKG